MKEVKLPVEPKRKPGRPRKTAYVDALSENHKEKASWPHKIKSLLRRKS